MIIISSRKNFADSEDFSDQDEAADLTLGPGGSILGHQTLEPAEVGKAVAGRSVLMLIHGYNNVLADVLRAYSLIEEKNTALLGESAYDIVIGYAWPGGDTTEDYFGARRRTSVAGLRFTSWLPTLASAASVDVMTHSMGTRVLLRGMEPGVPAKSARVRHHLATASAVDNDSIDYDQPFYAATQYTSSTWVFYSKRDPVLRYWYKYGELDLLDIALGLTGPDDPAKIARYSKNVRAVNCRKYVGEHGDYKKRDEVYEFIRKILANRHPKNKQFYTL